MPIAKKKTRGKLTKALRTSKKRVVRATRRTAKKRLPASRKKIGVENKEIAPVGSSVEVFEVVERQVYSEPRLGQFDEEED